MIITLGSLLEESIKVQASRLGVEPEKLVLDVLWKHFPPLEPFEPRDEWERRLFEMGVETGVSLPDSAFSRDNLYD